MPTAVFKVKVVQVSDDTFVRVGGSAFGADYNPGFPPFIDNDGHVDYEEPCNLVYEIEMSSFPDGSGEEFDLEVTYDHFDTDWIERDVAMFALFEENNHNLKFRKL